ncbi:MAG: polymer-forming cytoskeletal protein [Salinirussus sp.]
MARRMLLLIGIAVIALSIAPGLAAAETRAGGTVVIGAEETTGDLEVFGGDVVVRGTVDGDLRAFAGNVRIEGTVTGDVEAAAGNVDISGTVDGNVRATAGNVQVGVDGVIRGQLEAGAGSVIIAGTVGSLRAGAETISIAPTAAIRGDVEYDGTLDRASEARIDGTVTRNPDLSIGGPIPQVADVVFSAYFFIVNLIVGAILLIVFPRFSAGLADRTRNRPGMTGIVGLGTLIATPIILVLVAVTIVGIPLSLVGFLGYLAAIWLGIVYGRYVLGVWLLSLAGYANRWAALLLGLVVMVVVTRLPIIGGLADLAVLVWGLGALVMGLTAAYRNRRAGGSNFEAESPDDESGVAPG